MLLKFYERLVNLGLYKDLLAVLIAGALTPILAWRPLRRHKRQQQKIADLLDTNTPGGLSDLLDALADDSKGQQPLSENRRK